MVIWEGECTPGSAQEPQLALCAGNTSGTIWETHLGCCNLNQCHGCMQGKCLNLTTISPDPKVSLMWAYGTRGIVQQTEYLLCTQFT